MVILFCGANRKKVTILYPGPGPKRAEMRDSHAKCMSLGGCKLENDGVLSISPLDWGISSLSEIVIIDCLLFYWRTPQKSTFILLC